MNIDLTNTFKDSRELINTWKNRYSTAEYPKKVITNIFYRKYTIQKMWPTIFNEKYSNWEIAYSRLNDRYSQISIEITAVLLTKLQANQQVTSIKFSDFNEYIQSASKGNNDAIKGIEYTYFLHRIFDELILVWVSMVISGETKINAIAKITNAVLEEMPINDYEVIEQIFDQLGAEKYLQLMLIKELQNNI